MRARIPLAVRGLERPVLRLQDGDLILGGLALTSGKHRLSRNFRDVQGLLHPPDNMADPAEDHYPDFMAHHKRKRPKHRRSGCLLCKPHKLTANVKAERRKNCRAALAHERSAS